MENFRFQIEDIRLKFFWLAGLLCKSEICHLKSAFAVLAGSPSFARPDG
jgi:hypothetical protein